MSKGWIDAHTHLNDKSFIKDFDALMKRIESADIRHINLVGVNIKDARRAFSLVDHYPIFNVSIGLHPAELKDYEPSTIEQFRKWASDPRVVSIGEIGLDYHWHTDNIEEQKRVFIDQIQLANEVKKPVMIHSRDAMRDTIDILKAHKPLYGCVMHCFSGSVIEAHECIELGFMISIGGPVTFKNGVTPREVVNITPLDQLLIETDAPYLTPHPFRGKRNESSYIPLIGEQVANLKGLSISDLQEVLFTNYHRTFKSGL